MQQVKVSELASEFEMKNTLVISELKKVGVWVPSADTPVDHDIADRIRRRLQLILELEQQEEEKAREQKEKKEKKEKKVPTAKARKSIRQLGQPRAKAKPVEEEAEAPPLGPWASSLKPRKGKASYRKVELPEDEIPIKVAITIEDEPVIKKVEAQVSVEALEKARAEDISAEIQKIVDIPSLQKEKPAAPTPVSRIVRGPSVVAPTEAEPAVGTPAVPQEPVAGPPPVEGQEAIPEVAGELVEEAVQETPPVTPPQTPAPVRKTEEIRDVTFSEKITVKELSEKLQLKSNEVIKELFSRGVMATINQTLEQAVVEAICEGHGVIAQFVSFEQAAVVEEKIEEQPEDLVVRAPVVTVMGHVDHGKTSLLDAIRKSRVAASEAGGITQHIGAYQVEANGKKIVFIDTPGHEAFTRMRARGAQVTDLVCLVVAADDGIMPQTMEAIDHARAAEVPIIVAINKCDKPDAQPERVKHRLVELELTPEEWGGDTVVVEVSATEKTNLDSLLEMILLSADLLELKANPNRAAAGVVLEARLDRGRGVVATVLVQNGSLKVGDSFIAGGVHGKVRAMLDDRGKPVRRARPSTAVEILGLQGLPQAGDAFQVLEDAIRAREIAEFRQQQLREQEMGKSSRVSLDEFYAQMETGHVKELRVVLKADAQGSIEVAEDTLKDLSTERVQVKIIHSGVGAISESDVLLASASNAIVAGFNVRPEKTAQDAAAHEKVDVRLHTVIYEMADQIQQAMVGLLEPVFQEKDTGRAEVRKTFRVPKFGTIAGCYMQQGVINRKSTVRLLRDNVVVFEGELDSLRRFKEDVNEVKEGYECGISITNYNDIKIGDVIEAFVREEVAAQL